MPWSPAQRQRLAFEKTVLDKYFGDRVSWTDPTDKARVEVKVVCSDDKEYILRVYLPPGLPCFLSKYDSVTPFGTVVQFLSFDEGRKEDEPRL